MGLFSDIGGILPGAYLGFNKGVDDMKTRQQRDIDLKYQEEQRDRARSMAPIEDEAKVSRLRASIDEDKTAGIEGGIKRTLLEEQQRNLPQVLSDARIEQELLSAKTASDATSSLLAMGGQAVAHGDAAGLNKVFGHMVKAGLVQMPDGQKLEAPVSSSIINAPKGSMDFTGQPIEGRAIQATMPDGTKMLITPRYMEEAYKRQVQAADMASLKTVKPGEDLINPRTGEVKYRGQPRLSSGGYIDPETGEYIPTRVGSGSSGSSGKAAATPEAAGNAAFEAIYKNSNVKLEASQIADGQAYTVQAIRQGVKLPEDAARIGLDAALNPSKVTPDIDAKTGNWSGVYRNPSIEGGREFNLAPNFTSTQEVAKQKGGELVLKDAAAKLLDAQGVVYAPGKPELHAKIRDEFAKAAHDAGARARMIKATEPDGPEAVADLTRKLDLIKAYGPKPAKEPGSSGRNRLGVGGMGGSENYLPKPGTPSSVQDRMRERGAKESEEAARKAEANREKAAKQDAADAEGKKSVEWITPGAIKVLSGTEARKLRNGTEWKYLDSDLRKLLTIQAGRSD